MVRSLDQTRQPIVNLMQERVVKLDICRSMRNKARPVVKAALVLHTVFRQQRYYSGLQCLSDRLEALLCPTDKSPSLSLPLALPIHLFLL